MSENDNDDEKEKISYVLSGKRFGGEFYEMFVAAEAVGDTVKIWWLFYSWF